VPDARKSLGELRAEWADCTRCDLGVRRQNMNGSFVFGEGTKGTIMFIGDGPGESEEEEGRPFVGRSGELLRKVMSRLKFNDYYITNIVTCRSCDAVLDDQGQPRFRRGRGRGPALPLYRDQPPTPAQWKTCLSRLYEEIYLVDPKIIVSLGNTAAEALLGRSITITRDRGQEVTIKVPGAGFDASLTEKKQIWYRRVNGQLVNPVTQSTVDYLLIPTLHPTYVLRMIGDLHPEKSPFAQFTKDLRKTLKIYEHYMQEVFHQLPTATSDVSYEELTDVNR